MQARAQKTNISERLKERDRLVGKRGWVMQPDEQVLNGDPAVQDAGGWRKTAKGQLRPSERVETALNAR